jgi:hypothetical protein
MRPGTFGLGVAAGSSELRDEPIGATRGRAATGARATPTGGLRRAFRRLAREPGVDGFAKVCLCACDYRLPDVIIPRSSSWDNATCLVNALRAYCFGGADGFATVSSFATTKLLPFQA